VVQRPLFIGGPAGEPTIALTCARENREGWTPFLDRAGKLRRRERQPTKGDGYEADSTHACCSGGCRGVSHHAGTSGRQAVRAAQAPNVRRRRVPRRADMLQHAQGVRVQADQAAAASCQHLSNAEIAAVT